MTTPRTKSSVGALDTMYRRASVRRFTGEKVTSFEAEALLHAAMSAPSAGNQQPWEFYLVWDDEARAALSKASPYALAAAGAPLVIVPCFRQNVRFPECAPLDMAAATQNMLLEATDLGLGAVWMAINPVRDREEKVRTTLGLPDDLTPFCLIAVGRPAEDVTPHGAERYDEKRIHTV